VSGYVCGAGGPPPDALRTLTGLTGCCLGAAEGGPADCTCWEPIYDLEQQDPDTSQEPAQRAAMCEDCAYRPNSPERSGDPNYSLSGEEGYGVLDLGPSEVFWCHQGMRKPKAWRHPLGITVEATGDFYAPPIRLDRERGIAVPYKADGSPGDRCAGWAAHRRSDGAMVAELAERAGET